jgi:hypothetical protein
VQELARVLTEVDGIERRGGVLSFILRFKQICNHPAQWLSTGTYNPLESGKFLRLQALCEEIVARQEKVLVYTQFRTLTDPLAGFLKASFGRPGLVLHGQVAVKRRQRLVEEFQREDGPPFFVLSLKAGGTGLNLTAASHVIHFDRDNPAVWGSPQLVRPTHEAMNPARYGGHPAHGGRSHVTVHRYHRSRESLRVQGSVEGPGDDEDYQGNKWFHHSTPSGDMFLSS